MTLTKHMQYINDDYKRNTKNFTTLCIYIKDDYKHNTKTSQLFAYI